MLVMIRDGHVTLGVGRTVGEAVREACEINRQLRVEPTDAHVMLLMIDAGALKVREVRS